MGGKKDIKELRGRCERAALRVEATGREQFAVSLADASFITDLPSTPSSSRTLKRKLARSAAGRCRSRRADRRTKAAAPCPS